MTRNPTSFPLRAALMLLPALAVGQTPPAGAARPALPTVEPGLETAVKWKWAVGPSDEKNWGLPLPKPPKPPEPAAATPGVGPTPGSPEGTVPAAPARPEVHVVQKGDTLFVLAKKYSMTVWQLKTANAKEDDRLKIGEELRIPSLEELKKLQPPPPPPKPVEVKKPAKEEKPGKTKKAPAAPPPPWPVEARGRADFVLVQAFLDRELFSPGPIDGMSGSAFLKALDRYQSAHRELTSFELVRNKAQEALGVPYVKYALSRDDMRFIAPPKPLGVTEVTPVPTPRGKGASARHEPALPPLPYAEAVRLPFLAYRTPWEFVAERFHCDEAFLRKINPSVKGLPAEGVEFWVPNVLPFEIEKAFEGLAQPEANPEAPITATIVDLNVLEIRKAEQLVGSLPLAIARPDLRGRGKWKVLDLLPRPQMTTQHELANPPKAPPISYLSGSGAPVVPPPKAPPPPAPSGPPETLPPGPNNPAGILWINLTKEKGTEPLAFGLHGTSIPGTMARQFSIGGLRLSNWDVVRVAKTLPPGTLIEWK